MTLLLQPTNRPKIIKYVILFCVILIYLFILIRTAWLSDDAYITFRTVDNFINGYGLTWNTTERVQVYTHPLWMLLLSGIYFFTHEIYFSSLIFSIIVSLLVVTLFTFKISNPLSSGLLGMAILIFSRAFMDYSTSGLENPLTHLILVLFFWVYLQRKVDHKALFWLAWLAACAAVNRLDILLICLPVLFLVSYKIASLQDNNQGANHSSSADTYRSSSFRLSFLIKTLSVLEAGFLPLILWFIFSVFYYGFPFPNTAYAKLIIPIHALDLITQGFQYMIQSLFSDPITPIIIFVAVIVSLKKINRLVLPIGLGIILYLVYIIRIGGDFMEGRMLAAPLVCAVIILSHCMNIYLLKPRNIVTLSSSDLLYSKSNSRLRLFFLTGLGLFIIVIIGLSTPYPTIYNTKEYRSTDTPNDFIGIYGIADERGYYYQSTGLLKSRLGFPPPVLDHPWAVIGRQLRQSKTQVVVLDSIGFTGYYAGPTVHIVDTYGLADALISRLPSKYSPNWRIGHFKHNIPCGYLVTLSSGINQIHDRDLAAFYEKLSLITQGKLLDNNRMDGIWKMNTGIYTHWLISYLNRPGCSIEVNP